MASLLVLYNTPNDSAQFGEYYRATHTPLVKKMPGLRALTVSQGPINDPTGNASYHLIARMDWDSMEALQAALASPEGREVGRDLRNFSSGGQTILMYDTEEV